MSKTYQMCIEIEEVFHKAIREVQKDRRKQGLPFMNQETIFKLFAMEGVIQHHMVKQAMGGNKHDQL